MANLSAIKLPNGTTYNLKDNGALQLTGGSVTGPVSFGDSVSMDDLTVGQLVVEGTASVANNLQVNTINGVAVGNSPKFTDTNTEVSTLTLASGSTAGTTLAYGGKYTLTAGSKTVSFTMPSADDTNTWRTIQVNGTDILGSGTGTGKLNLKAGTGITVTNSSGTVTIASTITDTNTHRPIQMNGTEILGNNTTALNLKAGTNVSLSNSSGTITITSTDTNTWRGIQDNLTSTSTTESLSANQGRLLKNTKAEYRSIGSCADYQRVVIGLCELSANANSGTSSHTSGSIVSIRSNGLVPEYVSQFVFQDDYSTAKACNYSFIGNFENTSTTLRAGEGFRACTFTYNSKYYAGLEFYQTQARSFYWYGEGNFEPFLVAYYNFNTSAVLNTEINNSISLSTSVLKRRNITTDVSKVANSVAWSGVGSKPTTLSGYGITDAKIDNGVITLGSNTITPLTSHNNYSITDSGSGNAVTEVSLSGTTFTVTKGATFLTHHQNIGGKADKTATVSNVAYNSTSKKITKTINGTTTDVVTVATLKTALGSMPASDVSDWAKADSKPSYTASEVGAVPTTRTVNGKALSGDISLVPSDIGAAASSDIPTVSTITVNTTTTKGTYVGSSCHKYGRVVTLTFRFRNTSSTASGGDLYTGTLSSTLPAPYDTVSSVTYYGAHALVGILYTDRSLIIRNASNSAVQFGSTNTAALSFTYVCQ